MQPRPFISSSFHATMAELGGCSRDRLPCKQSKMFAKCLLLELAETMDVTLLASAWSLVSIPQFIATVNTVIIIRYSASICYKKE